MKRALAVLVPIIFCLSVSASGIYRSNILGQKLSSVDEIGQGYVLSEQEGLSILYRDGIEIKRIEEEKSDELTVVTEKDMLSGKTTVRTYTAGLLMSEKEESEGQPVLETSYSYFNGRLSFVTTTDYTTQVSETVFFLRSSVDGSPLAVRTKDSIRFFGEDYVFQDGNLYEIVSGNLVLTGQHSVNADGMIEYSEGDVLWTYYPDGRIMSVCDGTYLKKYFYEEGVLSRTETTRGDNLSVGTYKDGKEVSRSEYEKGVLVSFTELRSEGNIKTLYSEGRKVAVVYYRSDNRTVDRIEYN